MKPCIGIIGAGGFVGSALVESLVLDDRYPIRAIVRAYRSVASLSRFGSKLELRLADAEDATALTEAIADCAVVVNLTTGSPNSIIRSTRAILEACARASVKRFVHLSSAVVFGDVASPSIDDDSPPLSKHWMPYARAKADSERFLQKQIPASQVDIAVLRPGIIWGPRSPHTINIVESLLDKKAFLVDDGNGIFNGIYIDNLLACITTCCDDAHNVCGFYNVADEEQLTWKKFFWAVAPYADYDMARIVRVSSNTFPWSKRAVMDYVQGSRAINSFYHWLKPRVPPALKSALKSRLGDTCQYERPARSYQPAPYIDRELWHLQQTHYKLPTQKFACRFGFRAPVPFNIALNRTVSWLSYIGLIQSEAACAR
jgi:nucleoside-diphosphate-sugar epimerase